MMEPGTAMALAAGVNAVGNIAGGLIGGSGGKDGLGTYKTMSRMGLINQYNAGDLANLYAQPYMDLGYASLPEYQYLLTGSTPNVQWSDDDASRLSQLEAMESDLQAQRQRWGSATTGSSSSSRQAAENLRNVNQQLNELERLRQNQAMSQAVQGFDPSQSMQRWGYDQGWSDPWQQGLQQGYQGLLERSQGLTDEFSGRFLDTDQYGPGGQYALNGGRYAVGAPQNVGADRVEQDFTMGQVNVDMDALGADPIVQYLRDKAAEMTRRGLARAGNVNSSAGIDRVTDADYRTLADQVMQKYARDAGNEQRMLAGQGATADLGLANARNALSASQANAELGLRRDLANSNMAYNADATNLGNVMRGDMYNSGLDLDVQRLNYGRDIDAFQRDYGMLGDYFNTAYGIQGDDFNRQQLVRNNALAQLGNATRGGQQLSTAQGISGINQAQNIGSMGEQIGGNIGQWTAQNAANRGQMISSVAQMPMQALTAYNDWNNQSRYLDNMNNMNTMNYSMFGSPNGSNGRYTLLGDLFSNQNG